MSKAVAKEDYDLKKAWDKACEDFVRTTEGKDVKQRPKYPQKRSQRHITTAIVRIHFKTITRKSLKLTRSRTLTQE